MFKKAIIVMLIFLLTSSVVAAASFESTDVKGEPNPLYNDKNVLNYLLWTVDEKLEKDVEQLQSEFALSEEQMDILKQWGLNERRLIIQNMDKSVETFNSTVNSVLQDRNLTLRQVFGEDYYKFENWIQNWWIEEKEYRATWLNQRQSLFADEDRISGIFATQYNPNTTGAYEVALPDKYVKFANLGWVNDIPAAYQSIYDDPPYKVNVYYPVTNLAVNGVDVDEVGPWNTDDNYWNSATGSSNPRRLFTDLDLGIPEAYAAFYDDYNDGKDQSGRTVLNPAGIDLTPNVASDLGLAPLHNAWVDVRYEYLP